MNNGPRLISRLAGLTLAATLAVAAPAQPSAADTVVFRNGDLLYGKLLAIDGQNSVSWQHPDATEAITFKPDSIAQIDFPGSNSPAPRSNLACRLVLENGDTLEGDLVACDHASVTLQTWYAGRLSLPREALQSLVFIPRSPAVVDGITGLEGWTQGTAAAGLTSETGRWTYRNGAFYADKAASIARDVKLPDVAEIQFDLAWKGGLNLAVALYTDSLIPILLTAKEQGPNFGGFYSLRFQYSAFIDLWPIKKMEPLHPLGQLYLAALNNPAKDRLHVDLRVSKPQHKIALWLDGKPVKVWVDPEGFAGEGTGVRFVQNPPGIIKLSNLRITQWDGNFADTTDEPEDTTHDTIWSGNGAKEVGIIDYIQDGRLAASTAHGPVEFPLAALTAIDFAHRPGAPPPAEADTVRATFAEGGTISFVLDKWRPGEMTVHSAAFGKAKIDPTAFTRLRFVPAEKKTADEPKS